MGGRALILGASGQIGGAISEALAADGWSVLSAHRGEAAAGIEGVEVDGAPGEDWRAAFPVLAAYPYDLFDYAAEDRALDAMAEAAG
jgi:NAD(P)-dependent dehydrogenase (short-subunit alcohol dehydrogenase family)